MAHRFLNRVLAKTLFGSARSHKMSDDELQACRGFLYGVMVGSGWECKDYGLDFLTFQASFRPDWAKLYARFQANKQAEEWPIFGHNEGKVLFVSNNDSQPDSEEDLEDWSILRARA